MRGRVLRLATAVAGATALGLTFAGTAHADPLGNGGDRAYSSNDSTNADSDEAPDEDAPDEDAPDEDAPPRKKASKEGLYGLDEDPGTLLRNNLDGETESPGLHYDGIGTVELPRIATHS